MSQPLPASLPENSPEDSSSSRFLPILLILFFGSGCAALIYEVVWYQMLQLAIGSTSISVGVLLATFMGGLCIGSIENLRPTMRKRNPGANDGTGAGGSGSSAC